MTAAAKAVPGAAGSISSIFSAIAKALTPGSTALKPPGVVKSTLTPATISSYLPWVAVALGVVLIARRK
jgi:hypothetical protein